MTVRDLSEALKLLPPGARVMTSGRDTGWYDIKLTRERVVTSDNPHGARSATPSDTIAIEVVGISPQDG